MDGQINRWSDACMRDRQIDRWTYAWMNKLVKDGWMSGWMNGQSYKLMDGFIDERLSDELKFNGE